MLILPARWEARAVPGRPNRNPLPALAAGVATVVLLRRILVP
ncbi:hypothetical protein HRbin26_01595 [bacterium HR26]|nr:hypothetical protein HRbin26_01595 [bacterium HR26]